MSKRSFLAILALIAGIALFGVWNFKYKALLEVPSVATVSDKQLKKTAESLDHEIFSEDGQWKIYRNEKYKFNVNYPAGWTLEIRNTEKSKTGDDLFFFKKDADNFFAVIPAGGFGHGMPVPQKTTYEKFKGKEAKMHWYNQPFPGYIYVLNGIPENWTNENILELRVTDNDDNTLNSMNEIYRSFQFIE